MSALTCSAWGIKHAVYMEVDVEPSQQQAEAEYLIDICKGGKAPTIAMSNLANFRIQAGQTSESLQGGFEDLYDQAVNEVALGRDIGPNQ